MDMDLDNQAYVITDKWKREKEKKLQMSTACPLWQVVFGMQSSREVKLYTIYMVEYIGLSIRGVAHLFGKSPSSIQRWLERFRETGDVVRKYSAPPENTVKMEPAQQRWVLNYVLSVDPLSYLHEIREAFVEKFHFSVHCCTLSRFLASEQITKKVIERRAMQIRETDVSRFVLEVNSLRPFHQQLTFLDECSMDNRSLLRNKGWFFRNSKLVYHGTFVRSKRISLLAFLNVTGVVEVYREFVGWL
jgi:transposase